MNTVKDTVHRLVDEAPAAGDLYLLAELSQEFAQSLDIEDTLRNAVETIIRYLDAEAASVFLLEDDELVCRASAGPSPITGMRLPRSHGIVGRTLESGDCQMVRDVMADKDFNISVDETTGFRTRSIMCTPLQVRDRPLGVLQVLNKKGDPGLFSDHDLYVLRVLGVAVSLAIHNARMAARLVEQKRIRQELELARELQQRLLPEDRPEDFPLQGFNISAYEVSGDFYDWFELDDGRIGFTIGDVSGKGLNAALLMVRTLSLLRGLGRTGTSLPALMQQVNNELYESSTAGMFVCALSGIYDPRTREVSWCSAGFPAALHHTEDGKFTRWTAEAPPLGIVPQIEFPLQRMSLGQGVLYFYTDGATEARGSDGENLEEDGLQSLIRQHATLAPRARLAALAERLKAMNLRDDTTVMLLEDRPAKAQRLVEIGFPARADSLRGIRGVVGDAARTAGCSPDLVEKLVLALDEACSNIIRHAYQGDPLGQIVLTIDQQDRQLEFRLRDYAPGVDPGRLRAPRRKTLKPGGLGLQLIDSIMDRWELCAPEDGNGNLLVMTRTIG